MRNSGKSYLSLAYMMVLTACGSAGFSGTPTLADGEAIIWHYNCEGAQGMDVEYAQMGGSYSATLSIPDSGRKVLTQVGDGAFRLDEWQWYTNDERHYQLKQNKETVLQKCSALHSASVDDLRSIHGGVLSGGEIRD